MTGLLNFINWAIVPGRAFTRAMYHKLATKDSRGRLLKQHHHVSLNKEYILDCKVWLNFLLQDNSGLCQPFMDFDTTNTYCLTSFHSDTSKNEKFGIGAVFNNKWISGTWPINFIAQEDPSIAFLELYALTVAVVTWQKDRELRDRRVSLFCDNESVMYMINNSSSSCNQCMKLTRILTLGNIKFNRRIKILYIKSQDNFLADSLSRMDFDRFWKSAPSDMSKLPTKIPDWIWPVNKIWNDQKGDYLNKTQSNLVSFDRAQKIQEGNWCFGKNWFAIIDNNNIFNDLNRYSQVNHQRPAGPPITEILHETFILKFGIVSLTSI